MKKIITSLSFLCCFATFIRAQNISNGLILHLNFSGNFTDSSANAFSATVGSGVSLTSDRMGSNNSAAAFDGSANSYISFADNSVLRPANISVSMLIKPSANTRQYNALMAKRSFAASANEMYNFTLESQSKLVANVKRNSNCVTGTGWETVSSQVNTIPSQAWTHVAFTYDSTTVRIYKNGVLISSVTVSSPGAIDNCTGAELLVGSAWGTIWNTANFIGLIDDIRVYDRVISNQEVAILSSMATGNQKILTNTSMRLFPNPINSSEKKITITFDEIIDNASVKLVNSLGQDISNDYELMQNDIKLNVKASIPSGVYYIQGMVNGSTFSHKVLVN